MSIIFIDGSTGEACFRCRNASELWVVAPFLPDSDRLAMLCNDCIGLIAREAGFIHTSEHAKQLEELNSTISLQEAKLNEIPNLMKEVIDGTNNILSDFIVSIASITSASKPVQPESNKANTGNTKQSSGKSKAVSSEHEQNNHPSVKFTE